MNSQETIYTSNTDENILIENILKLYNNSKEIHLDPCYSKGVVWKNIKKPMLKFDIFPEQKDVIFSDCRKLPLNDESIESIYFDPPFVAGSSKTSIICNRFSAFETLNDLKEMYSNSMKEFNRILINNGLLIFKCQDTTYFHKQFFTHSFIIQTGESINWTCHDLFILNRKSAIISKHIKNQEHARKNHCYYLVFTKGNKNPAMKNKIK